MIPLPTFCFAVPPHTGVGRLIKSLELLGFEMPYLKNHIERAAMLPFGERSDSLKVTLVRHPYDWLVSYYSSSDCEWEGSQSLNAIIKRSVDFDEVVRQCCDDPGILARVFDQYKADTVMRTEDFPWCVTEFFMSLGYSIGDARRACVGLYSSRNWNSIIEIPNSQELRAKIVASESEFCDRYEYYR